MRGFLQYQLSNGQHHSGKIKLLCDRSLSGQQLRYTNTWHSFNKEKKIQLLEKNIRLKVNYTEFLFSARMHYIELKFFVI